ncbi:MAG: biotin/lipoyl-binding protein [Reinekea sp.]|nr:biotin/lipoyl-binding protein [Reinekea sp.]
MIKKLAISTVILALGIAGYQWLNKDSAPRAGGPRPTPTTTSAQTTSPQTPPAPTPKPANSGPESANLQRPAGQSQTNNETNVSPEAANTNAERPQPRRGGGMGMNTGTLARQASTSVEVMRPVPQQHRAKLNVFGVIDAQTATTLAATSGASVIQVHRQEGDRVSTGDLLVTLASDNTQEQLRQRRAALAEIDARIRNEQKKHENDLAALEVERELLRISKNSVDRFTSLNAQQLSSNTDYETALRSYQSQLLSVQNRELIIAQYDDNTKQWQAQRAQLQSQIRQSEQLVTELMVRAPFNGVLAKITVNEGQEVRTGDTVVELYNPDSLALFVRVPIRYRLDQNQLSELNAIDDQGIVWQAKAIRPVNESGAQRLTLVPASGQAIESLPGTHLSLTLSYPLLKPTIDVPLTAVYDQQRVYSFDRDSGAIQANDITILGRSESGYLIDAEGLKHGAPIVTTRLKNPVTGMRVSPSRGQQGDRL